ncbi:hypothetical protein [Rhodohalobacter sp. 8-1]|uniref:hypothetical protein n=1 Tax=Rhodohalobacter sp. 8-1 TaxID=3131972 RepID=UPI0030EEF469
MNKTVFGTKEFEKPYIRHFNNQQYEYQFTHQAPDAKAVKLAGYSNLIIVFPVDGLSSPVIRKLIKTDDLTEPVKQGGIECAGLFVYENGKGLFFYDHKEESLTDARFTYLPANSDIRITGHPAFATEEAFTNLYEMIMDAITALKEGEEPGNQL